jgi:hypothetical protein
MLKYTSHPDIIREYNAISKHSSKRWDDHYNFAVSICGSTRAYFDCGDFWRHYLAVEYYSTKRNEVPVNGVLIPVHYFKETRVE